MNKRALFVVDHEHGLGHVVRSRELMHELAERGMRCSMVNRQPGSWSSHDVVITDGVVLSSQPSCAFVSICDHPWDRYGNRGADLLVCGSAGAVPSMFDGMAKTVLAGPDYSLLRVEFRDRRERMERCFAHQSLRRPETLDVREISGLSADDLAGHFFSAVVCDDTVLTYGGMRASEAACVGVQRLTIFPRNKGEELNAAGLRAGRIPDGLGCKRVADQIVKMFG